MKTILVAINNDDKALNVLNTAIGMAKRYNADLIIAHVNQIVMPQTSGVGYAHGSPITIESFSKDDMNGFKKLAQESNIKNVEAKIIEGLDVASIITGEFTDKYQPDLIIIGDNKHHSFIEQMLGSTASGVAKRSKCSVFIVK